MLQYQCPVLHFIGIIHTITACIQLFVTKWHASHTQHNLWSVFDFYGSVERCNSKILKDHWISLRQQCDQDMPCTFFPSGYLPDAHHDDGNSTGKSGSENERCVAVYFTIYVILEVLQRVGADMLSSFVHVFDTTILFICSLIKVFQKKIS